MRRNIWKNKKESDFDKMKPGSVEYSKDNPVYLTDLSMGAGDYGSVSKPLGTSGTVPSDTEPDLSLSDPPQTLPAESSYILFFQVLFPFLIAGFGMVLAGIVLDVVQHWDLFQQVPETFILVPALLGLKGNLEMTLASRLSTQVLT
jgi:hypothetical protein